ncbi:BTB/POZ domain-containing protein 2-like [Daphnia magna]|uniref:BTB domain-containing protein n=1 Tax=Daphnia magna TaxID=35525 RepID=A0ABQ9YYN3_9CRUS|nr:BTB/POZ domain-containing protein 2-like [Daphnia magna]KAK4005709.1 hypothetical protein OUZ56_010784 [Daphnia magna]
MANRRAIASNVDWQVDKKSNSERAKYLFETSLYCDCEFLVGNEEEKELVKAHKIFLAMGSPVFETMFYGGMAQANAGRSVSTGSHAIEVQDIQPFAFKDLLEFIYTEHVDLKSFEQAYEISYAAKKYMVSSLVEKCSQYMWKDLIPDNVCRALEFANLFEDTLLKERSLNVIRCRTKDSLSHPPFEDITESTLLILVKEDDLAISETDLFEAVKRWGTKECARREIDVNGSNLRLVLANIIGHIRFLTMTNEEFASSPAMSGILTQEESFAVLMNISCRDKWQMPSQLSSSRQSRYTAPYSLSFGENSPGNRSPSSSCGRSVETAPVLSSPGRIYCYRRVEGEALVHNTGILDCAVALTVDRNICIQGIVISSQSNHTDSTNCDPSGGYTELLYCHLLDRDGTRLTYSHFSGRSPRRSSIDVFFNRPVYVQRNREYRICVVLNRCGYYPLGTGSSWVMTQGVHFRFGSSSTDPFPLNDGIRDGFIRGVIFSF